MPEPTQAAPAAATIVTTPTPPATPSTPPAPAAGSPPAPAAAPPPARDPISATLAEVNRKEAQFRQEKKKWDDERKAATAAESERATKEAERAAKYEAYKTDLQTLLEDHGWTTEAAIDFMAKGGATSPEGQIRALRLEMEKKDKDAAAAKKKAEDEAQAASVQRAQQEARAFVEGECKRLLTDDRFELCSKTEGIESEVTRYIVASYERDGIDVTPEQALLALESVLDTRALSYAQSKKLKAKLAPTPPDGSKEAGAKPEANRHPEPVPSANKRTITIKQRQQAVAPLRLARDGRAPRSEVAAEVAANFASLLARK